MKETKEDFNQEDEKLFNEEEEDEAKILNKENEAKILNKEEKGGKLTTKEENEEFDPKILSKLVSDSNIGSNDEKVTKEQEKKKEIRNSNVYITKDYLFFFSLMISSSMNFSYLYIPLILLGIVQKFFIGKNDIPSKALKSKLEYFSLIYSVLLLVIKIICLYEANNDAQFISENEDFFLDIGICYLRNKDSSFYFTMTFLGESIVILLSLYSIIISHACFQFKMENDASLMKNDFWSSRNLIILNYIFILSFAVFNTSFLTLFYLLLLQILLCLSSIKLNRLIIDKIFYYIIIIFQICILLQVGLVNIFNIHKLQENVLYDDEIKDKDGNSKPFSIFTQIGINYSYNEKLSYVWKEWIGYLFAILSLITLSYSFNNIKIKKQDEITPEEKIDSNENINIKSTSKQEIPLKEAEAKTTSLGTIFRFIISPICIIQFCRIISIFYIYFYPNFYSIGIFISFLFSSVFTNVNQNKPLTLYLLTPMVVITSISYHISNINGFFENFNEEKRRRYLNFALGKFEYSFLEYYGHHLFFMFIMFLLYSFDDSTEKTIKIKGNKDFAGINEIEEPLLRNTVEDENNNIIEINPIQKEEKFIIVERKDNLTFWNILLKYIFSNIDKITLIAMYFVSMRSINLIHLVLVIIFIIQIILPAKLKKLYFFILCVLHILLLVELLIHLIKAYCFDSFNDSKDAMNFILSYSDKIMDNDMELLIFIVLYCFYFEYQIDTFKYLTNIVNSNEIELEKYIDNKYAKYPKTKYVIKTLGTIISNLYIWVLIGVFFVFSTYFEINFIFAIKLAFFFVLSFNVLRRIQNRENGKKFNPVLHYIFLLFCSIHSFLTYLYQFRSYDFINSKISDSDNFFAKNLPQIGFSIYQNDYLYFNFLPHFGIMFISVLFINEIQRQFKKINIKENIEFEILNKLKEKKDEIYKKLQDKDLIDEDIELLKSDIYEENEKVLKQLSRKYFFKNIIIIITKFYWLFLFLSIGIIFCFYDLSFSMVIYIIIFSIIFILTFYRRITKLTKYINKPKGSYFISKVIRYSMVERPITIKLNEYYRFIAFKYLLIYNFVFIILLYLYGVFDLFQHGCNNKVFKGCEESYDTIFEQNGTTEDYIKSFAYLFGIYVDIREEGLIKVAWIHIILSLLIGFDIYSQKIEKKYSAENESLRENILIIYNENNTLFKYFDRRDTNIGIKIGLKLAGIASSEEVIKRMKEEYFKEKERTKKKKLEKKGEKKEDEKIKKIEDKKEKDDTKNKDIINEKVIEINTNVNNEEIINIKDDKRISIEEYENLEKYKFLKMEEIKKFLNLFSEVENNKQRLNDTNNNSTKVIWFVKKMFEELIIVLLICVSLTKLNLLSFIYVIYFIYLTMTKKTMYKFYILYCILLLLIIIQSSIYITNISIDTCPRRNDKLLKILKDTLSIPWYDERLSIEKKYAFFFGFGINKTQIGLLLLEYVLVILEYIYFDFFSFSMYQDIINKGEEKSKFKFGKNKISSNNKTQAKKLDNDSFIQYKECLKNFNVDIGNSVDEMVGKLFTDETEPKTKLELKCTDNTLDTLVYFKAEIKMSELKDDKVPDSEFTKSIQEFVYLYLHIFFLFLIIIISIMVIGLISIFYLLVSFVYLINSHKIYLGLKYGYPKQIKNVLKICLIVDISIQLLYQIPYISPEKDSILYKIFDTLGYSKLLNYSDGDDSNVEIASTGIIEIIGKPLIYLIISLQTIIYNSTDFKRFYIIFLLNLKENLDEVGFINSYIFNNSRINEFNNSFNLRITYEKKMNKVKEKVIEISEKLEGSDLLDDAMKEPLKYFKEKEKEKKQKEEIKKGEIEIGEKKQLIEVVKEDKKENILEEKIEENKYEDKENTLENNIKSKGALSLLEELGKKNKQKLLKIIKPEKVKAKIKKILMGGKLMKLYSWFSSKSTSSFKSMESKNRENFRIDAFRNVPSKSYIENEIDENMSILDLSNFNHKEVNIIEEFFSKFKEGKLNEEIDKIKNTIKKEKLDKFKENKINDINNENNIINTNANNENIIINDNNEDNINEKEMDKIEVEYNIKRGGTDININTMKFKQFYYLLDTNVFKYYFSSSYLFKTIFSVLGSFFSSNFDYLIYLLMIIDHMINCSILSLFYPLSIFCYALLENPRPKKSYWQVCLYYTIFVIIAKFIFQLKLFESIMGNEQYSDFINKLYNYKIGIRYFEEGFGTDFFSYIIFDSLLLLFLSLNKNILISNGLWDKREEQRENIYLANERVQKFKDIDTTIIMDKLRLFISEYYYGEVLKIIHNKRELLKKESAKKVEKNKENPKTTEDKAKDNENDEIKETEEKKEEEKKEENKEGNKEQEKKQEENEDEEEENSVDDDGTFNEDDIKTILSFYYLKMFKESKYDEGDKNYFNKLFPKIRNEKPGTNKYPFLLLSLTLIIIYILLFFTQMARDNNYGPVNLDTTQFSGNMVLFLTLHVIILLYDRVIYVSQNRDDLKYKYFIYKKNIKKIGKAISKSEYNKIKTNYGCEEEKPFHFTPGLIQSLIENEYNIFYIQTEKFNKPLLQKYLLHLFTILICHGFAFFYFPMIGNYNTFNSIICSKDDSDSCNNFNNNTYIIFFYILYLIYLYFSSVQIRLGYYDIKRISLFKRNTPITNIVAQIFNAIPFLPQIHHVIDWTYTTTCFDLFQWIKFESIYTSIFEAYKKSDENDDAPIGKKVERKKQKGFGNILSLVLVLILVVPLFIYSSLNPTNKLNNITGGKLILDLSFIYENDIKLNYNLFENSRAQSIEDMFKNGDTDWKKYNYDQSAQTMNFEHNQTQIIKFSETSDRNWDLAEPHIKNLIEILNITNNKDLKYIDLKISVEFERPLPAEAQTVSHEFNLTIFNSSMDPETSEGGKKILQLKNALENCSDVTIDFEGGYSSPLRFRAGSEVLEIEDKKYISKKNIQLGFQGCEIEQRILINETKFMNNYLRSYFTFKSKDPKDKNYTGIEFHAFNDKISDAFSGYTIISFYVTFILVAGKYIADFLSSEPEKIMYTDLPHPELIIDLCEGITISRYNNDFKEEEHLYTILIELMRSPDILKKITQSSITNLEIRKQNNVEKEDEEEEEEKELE